MSEIRDIIFNKIIDFLIISWSKEWWRLTVVIIVGIIIVTVWYLIRKAKKEIALVDELYWRQNLAPNLGWKDLKYPIIGFGWDFAEPIQILSRYAFKENYGWWLRVKYIVDSDLKKYSVNSVRLEEIWWTDPRIAKIKFPKVENSQERIDFEEMKIQMIQKIKRDEMSCYKGLEQEMKQTKNINELAQVMNKWEY